jgi:hypothetical protein
MPGKGSQYESGAKEVKFTSIKRWENGEQKVGSERERRVYKRRTDFEKISPGFGAAPH